MDNSTLFSEISRHRTKELMILKMGLYTEVAMFRSMKTCLLGLITLFVSQLASTYFSGKPMTSTHAISVVASMVCIVKYVIVDRELASGTAQIELIKDLLALRMNRTGKRR